MASLATSLFLRAASAARSSGAYPVTRSISSSAASLGNGHSEHSVAEHNKPKPRVLVTGAIGQIGMELVDVMRTRYGNEAVVASDVRSSSTLRELGPFAYLDVTNQEAIAKLVVEHDINTIVHLASLLSAVGERNPQLAMKVNARGSENVLEVAAIHKCKVFIPSTIAVFGPTTPRDNTRNSTILRPTTIYGTTKVSKRDRL
jgi:threonine 3-dehydrogenase